jgi:hypothetical protein
LASSGRAAALDPLYRVQQSEYGPEYRAHLLEQYKLAVERADAVSERRATVNEFYLVLMSVILSVAGIGVGGTFAGTPILSPKIVPWVSLVGVVVAGSWLVAIYASNQLNRAKFHVINRLEERLPAAVFTVEWNFRTTHSDAGPSKAGRLYTSSTYVESIVPACLLLLFLGLTIYLF